MLFSSSILEILFSQMQFTGLNVAVFKCFSSEVPKPARDAWGSVLGWTETLNSLRLAEVSESFGFEDLAETVSDLPWSWFYLVFACITPLCISFLVLLLFKSTFDVLWLFAITAGVGTTLVGFLLAYSVPIEDLLLLNPNLSPEVFTWAYTIGLVMVGGALFVRAAAGWFQLRVTLVKAKFKLRLTAERYKRKDTASIARSLAAVAARSRYGAPRPPMDLIRTAILGAGFFLIGVGRYIDATRRAPPAEDGSNSNPGSLVVEDSNPLYSVAVQVIAFSLSAICFVFLALCLFETGRKRLEDAATLTNQLAMSGLLFCASFLYVPIARFVFTAFVADDEVCDAGEWYPTAPSLFGAPSLYIRTADGQLAPFELGISDETNATACQQCQFINYGPADGYIINTTTDGYSIRYTPSTTCPAFDSVGFVACPGEERTVLNAERALDFYDSVAPFYFPASILMFIGFTGMLIVLFARVVSHHERELERVPIDPAALAEVAEREAAKKWSLCGMLSCSNPRTQTGPLTLTRGMIGGSAAALNRGLSRTFSREGGTATDVEDGADAAS